MALVHLNSENFEAEVIASDVPVLVDFYATWCGPCKMVAPIIEEIANERTDVKVCKLDVDEAIDIARQYQIASIPTLLLFHGGEVVNKAVGARDKDGILELLEL